jgi:hypothetical protein
MNLASLNGSFHFASIKHSQRYLDESADRFNRRKDDGAFYGDSAAAGGIRGVDA